VKIKRMFYIILAIISLVLGTIGWFIPILPSVPFIILAAFCFGRSSQKLHEWFIGTSVYKNNLQAYVEGRGMTVAAKVRITATVTVVMGTGFVLMMNKKLIVPCVILGVVWIFHLIHFIFGVKTIGKLSEQKETKEDNESFDKQDDEDIGEKES